MQGCDANVNDILNAMNYGHGLDAETNMIAKEDAVPPGKVVLMGYSKGAADIMTLLAYHPELKDRVQAVITWAGAVNGAFKPNDIVEQLKTLDTKTITDSLHTFLNMVSPGVVIEGALRRLAEYDIKSAILDLTSYRRKEFMDTHGEKIDALDIPIFSFTGSTSVMEVPHFQMSDTIFINKYDSNNDMQLTQKQAIVDLPMGMHVAMLHGHHWDLSYGAFPKGKRLASPNLDHPFPKEAVVTAHFRFLAELGLMD